MFSAKIVKNFKADFEYFVKGTFIYAEILEECKRKIEEDNEDYETYLKVYKEILKELN